MIVEVKNDASSSVHWVNRKTVTGILLISAIYFADMSIKASHKCFWFDELITTYLCRLHDFGSTWTAVLHGADFNPPLLYLFTRAAQWLFGEGLISTRLPAMIGLWVFGICLFLFVAQRRGVVSGFIAGTFPFFTLAQYYGYEARAHGIVLGWCGLTLVCWQKRGEAHARGFWLVGFGLCLLGAFLTHLYAVYILLPFFLVELYNLFHNGRPDWGIVATSVLILISVSTAVYLPLFRMYRLTVPATFFAGSHDLPQRFLVAVIGPALGVLIIALVLFALERPFNALRVTIYEAVPTREILVALGFVCIPLVGLLGAKVSHGPFIDRYFLSSVAGYAIFMGFACSCRLAGSWTAHALAGCMLLLMIGELGTTIYLSIKHRIVLVEPSTGLVLSTNPANPMERYETLQSNKSDLDILVLSSLDYLYFFRYAPPSVVSHLSFLIVDKDVNSEMFRRIAETTGIDLRMAKADAFLATRGHFFVYARATGEEIDARRAFVSARYRLKSIQPDTNGAVYEYER